MLVSIETVVLIVLVVLVSGLLRSHADILRALHRLGFDADGDRLNTTALAAPTLRTERRPGGAPLAEASDLTGTNLAGDAVAIAVTNVAHDTLLAFLTTGCSACQSLWRTMKEGVAGDARLVAVVHDPDEESLSKLHQLVPPAISVVLSSDAWRRYQVDVAPFFVYVSGPEARIVGQGSSSSWSQVASLIGQANGDTSLEPQPGIAEGVPPGGRHPTNDAGREARADAELAAAGILPGDPRLYPTRIDGGLEQQ